PLLARPLSRPWTLDMRLEPVQLSGVPAMGTLPALTGQLGAHVDLAGKGDDVGGTITMDGERLGRAGDASLPRLDLHSEIAIRDDAIGVVYTAHAAKTGVEARKVLDLRGTIGLGGRGLLRAAKRPATVQQAPLSINLEV